jgi:hypothetical protein
MNSGVEFNATTGFREPYSSSFHLSKAVIPASTFWYNLSLKYSLFLHKIHCSPYSLGNCFMGYVGLDKKLSTDNTKSLVRGRQKGAEGFSAFEGSKASDQGARGKSRLGAEVRLKSYERLREPQNADVRALKRILRGLSCQRSIRRGTS